VQRQAVLGANWKMNMIPQAGVRLVVQLKELLKDTQRTEIIIFPPFPALLPVGAELAGTNMLLGGQNLYWEKEGAYTGEVSAAMLKACGCDYVIVGHSERRHILGETDSQIAQKVRAALDGGLRPLLCVGELLEQREAGQTEKVIKEQLAIGLSQIKAAEVANLIVAYEPVWAIGTGKTASAADANEVCGLIRAVISTKFGVGYAEALRIQYGGSVKPENVQDFCIQPEIDGVLVGGASLQAAVFAQLVKNIEKR
jgi:triosephosphate isomerase